METLISSASTCRHILTRYADTYGGVQTLGLSPMYTGGLEAKNTEVNHKCAVAEDTMVFKDL